MDVRMPDGTIIKNVPENITKAQLAVRMSQLGVKTYPQAAQKNPVVKQGAGGGVIDTAIRSASQGATAGFSDEISAGMDAVTQPILKRGSGAPTIGGRYDENLVAERTRLQENAAENPVTDIGANVVGAVAGPGKFLKKPTGAISLIKQNAALGAIYGFGTGEGGIKERLIGAGEGGLIGGGTGAIIGGGTKIFDAIRPSNIGAKYVNKQFAASPMVTESERIGREIGQTYTPGQSTGSKALLTIEGMVRRHPASADRMAAFDAKQMDVSLNNLVRNLDNLHANPSGPEATGNLVSKAFDKVLDSATKVRRTTAKADFDKVDELAGRYRVIKPNTLLTTLDDLAKDFSTPGGGDASANLVKQIGRIKTDLERAGPQGLSAKETQRLLEVYGNAARGTGAIFKDMDTGQQRMIAGKIKDALVQDIDNAADAGGHVGEIATALKAARDNYKTNSAAINELEKSVLGRLFGGEYDKAPERIAQTMRNMKPSELKQSMAILSKADPATSQSVKRFMVEDAMAAGGFNSSSSAPAAQMGGETAFSAPKFLTAIRKSPVWDSLEPAERASMMTAVRDLERVAFRAGTDGSPTAPLMAAMGILSRPIGQVSGGALLGGGAAAVTGGDIKEGATAGAMAGGLGGMAIPRIAKLITTPEGQKALRTLRISKPNAPAAIAATSALVSMISGGEKHEPQ